MSLFLTTLAILAALILTLEVRRRIRKASGRLGRPRNAAPIRTSVGLNLDRPAPRSGGGRKKSGVSHVAGPVVLGLVFILMGSWLAFSYFLPDAETTAAMRAAPPEPQPVQTKALGGRLTAAPEAGAASGLGAAKPATSVPQKTFVADAAALMMTSYSRLDQVGLLPAKMTTAAQAAKPAPSEKTASAKPKAGPRLAEAPKPATEKMAQPAPKQTASVSEAAAPSSLVGAASGAAVIKSSLNSPGREDGILGGGRDFTVHLGSFRELDNAEQYKGKLNAAGEGAFITETVVNGQHWYRVMSGRFKARSDAEIYGRDLKRRGLAAGAGQYLIKNID